MNFSPIVVEYANDAHKLLSDNRDAYIAQSAASRNGEVAQFRSARKAGLTRQSPANNKTSRMTRDE